MYCQNVDNDDDNDDNNGDDDEDDKLPFCLDDDPLNELSTLQCLKELATFLQHYTGHHYTLQ